MRRGFYLALGATVGVFIVRRLTRTAESLKPNRVAQSLVEAASDFIADVRTGMAEREAALREMLDAEIPASDETSGSL